MLLFSGFQRWGTYQIFHRGTSLCSCGSPGLSGPCRGTGIGNRGRSCRTPRWLNLLHRVSLPGTKMETRLRCCCEVKAFHQSISAFRRGLCFVLGDGASVAQQTPVTELSSQNSQLLLTHSSCLVQACLLCLYWDHGLFWGGVYELHKQLPRCPRFSLAIGLRADGNIEHGCLHSDELFKPLHFTHSIACG